uniref:ATP-citrate synthase n=1 Tax=Ciona savignyi TaxID=51511 RepID=H2ZP62_CIOSA
PQKLIVKPDQLIKRRGKLGLIKINTDYSGVQQWVADRMMKEFSIGETKGILKQFIIEPFVAHKQEEEFYICIHSSREENTILFHHEGGVDIGDVDSKANKLPILTGENIDSNKITDVLLNNLNKENRRCVSLQELLFTTKPPERKWFGFVCARQWGPVEFPPPFGREAYPEEAYIADLDAKSGASLKLTILNPNGRIWTMVAGGGASVVYRFMVDTICDLGGASELANYGEYSGAPSEQQTYDYARTILSLMTRTPRDDGKVLIIGGGIANFTNVAATVDFCAKRRTQLSGRASRDARSWCVVSVCFLSAMLLNKNTGQHLGVPVHVFGTETHMTAIVGMALGKTPIPDQQPNAPGHTANFLLGASSNYAGGTPRTSRTSSFADGNQANGDAGQVLNGANVLQQAAKRANHKPMFTSKCDVITSFLLFYKTRCIMWGLQSRAVQGMLDFDFVCSRKTPSVAAMVYPFSGDHKQKFYWGHKEILIPVYKNMSDAMTKHNDADVLISFASLRSAEESTIEAMKYEQIRTIAIIAEGIPESTTKKLNKLAQEKNISIIGPATVGGIKPGCFKIGNTGGMMDNILSSKLYRAGSVAYVSRSGGMSNELNNIISRTTNGVCEGVAIGGDRYPGTTFMDHILRYQNDMNVKMIVVLGEVGGTEEYDICEAIKSGTITKPVIAWCIGTCATMFTSEVQFGHAGACANQASETAVVKNQALAAAGAHVPCSFNELNTKIREVYNNLVELRVVVPKEEVPPPTVPMDYSWARELGLIRKPASFMSSISDERGQELLYAGMPISQVFKDDIGIGGGDRFGGALDGAARQFSAAYDKGLLPSEFVNEMRKKHQLIMGIGHRVKSLNNPDQRVVILKEFVKTNFPSTPLLDYALEVEKVTTAKKPNLILNVDGFIGVAFVDLLRGCGCFTEEEAREYVQIGALNGVFVLGRSMGFIGHYLDQLRLKQGLYRHPWDDISYVLPEDYSS